MEILSPATDQAVEIQGRFTMSDGFELYYRQWKAHSETDKVVVCLHGLGGHSGLFRNIGPGLAVDGVNVYAIDRRGFGNSVEAGFERGGVSSFARYLQDVSETIDLVGASNPGKKLFTFGKSLGCHHALRYGANKAESLDGLILAAPPIVTSVNIPAKLLVRMLFLLLFSPKTMVDGVEYLPQKVKESDELKMSMGDPLCTQRFSGRYLNGVRSIRGTAMKNAALVQKPTLILQGNADKMVEPAGAEKLLKLLGAKDKTLKTFTDADHNFYDALSSRVISKHDPSKRAQVIGTVREWIRTH